MRAARGDDRRRAGLGEIVEPGLHTSVWRDGEARSCM